MYCLQKPAFYSINVIILKLKIYLYHIVIQYFAHKGCEDYFFSSIDILKVWNIKAPPSVKEAVFLLLNILEIIDIVFERSMTFTAIYRSIAAPFWTQFSPCLSQV